MFTVDSAIDAVQNSKKQFISTFITNKAVADALNDFIDAQSEYTKSACKTGFDVADKISKEFVRNLGEVHKFDLNKFNEQLIQSSFEFFNYPKTKK